MNRFKEFRQRLSVRGVTFLNTVGEDPIARANKFDRMGRYNPTALKTIELFGVQKAIETGRIDVLEEYLPARARNQ